MKTVNERTPAHLLAQMGDMGVKVNEWALASWRGLEAVPVKIVPADQLARMISATTEPLMCSPALHGLGYISVWDGHAFCIAWPGFSVTGEAPPPAMVSNELAPMEF